MSDDLIAVKATEPDQTPDESIPGSSLPDECESPGQILNPSESASPPDSPRQNADDYRFNQNMVFLRGVIRGIRQELDPEDRQSNVITVTTPNPLAGNQVETGLLDVYWGSNSRAGSLLSDFKAGDHVVIEAECRTFRTALEHGEILYGMTIRKDLPAGITGLGDFEPARNEAFFIGTLRSVRTVSERMELLHMALHTHTDGRDISSYPMIAVYGRADRVFRQNAARLAVGKLVGLACHIQLRPDKATGKMRIRWLVHGLIAIGEDGGQTPVRIPPPYSFRAPRNNGPRSRVSQTVRSSAAEDLNLIRTGSEESSDEAPSASDRPAVELEPRPGPGEEELIEFRPAENTAEILTNEKIREMARRQALESMESEEETP